MFPDYDSRVVRTDCGSVVKYRISDYHPSHESTYWRIPDDKEHYVDRQANVREFKKSQVKGDNLGSVARSFARLRDLINSNFADPRNVLFVTLTYDPKQLQAPLTLTKVSRDMAAFFRGFRADFPCQYIYVVEQQGNGNWHVHSFLFFDREAPYLDFEQFKGYWSAYGVCRGRVYISKRFSAGEVDNVGAYLCADITGTRGYHTVEKFARLKNYPSHAHLYRCSKGIKRPVITETDFDSFLSYDPGTKLYERRSVLVFENHTIHHFLDLHFSDE